MRSSILESVGITDEEYQIVKDNKFFRRALILEWLKKTNRITNDEWLNRLSAEAYANAKRESE